MHDAACSPLFIAKIDPHGRVCWRRILEREAPPWGFTSEGTVEAAPNVEPLETDRDSFAPHMMDDIAAFERKLARGRTMQRAIGLAMVLLTLSVAGASVAHAGLPKSTMSPAIRVGIGEAIRGRRISERLHAEHAHFAELRRIHTPSPAELRERTVTLLSQAKPADALPLAQALVAAQPEDAFAYLCLGSALLDLGRTDEARTTFLQCIEHAKRGNIDECRALAQ
jgi:hypothetical protein